MGDFLPVLLAAFGIGLLIFIHELGHFICARMAGVRVEVFSLGFGQRLFGFVHKGTDYRLSLFPLGGYVRVAGEDPNNRQLAEPGDLYATGFGARAWFFSGGVLMNLLFALVTFPIVFGSGVKFLAPVVGTVAAGSPAWEKGVLPGDRINSINGKETYSFENLRVEIALAGRKPIELEIVRGEAKLFLTVQGRYSSAQGLYGIGISPALAAEPLSVNAVIADSPAARAGLRPKQKILSIQGETLLGAAANVALDALTAEPGKQITLEVEDDDGRATVTFLPEEIHSEALQIGVAAINRRIAAIRTGDPLLQRLGLKVGDAIDAVEGIPFHGNLATSLQAMSDDQLLNIDLHRNGLPLQVSAEVSPEEKLALPTLLALEHADDLTVVPTEGRPAHAAGLLAGDRITHVDGKGVTVWQDLVDSVTAAGAQEIQFQVKRGTEELTFEIKPDHQRLANVGFDTRLNRLTSIYQVDTVPAAIKAGAVCSLDLIKSLYVTLKKLFTGDVAARNLGGIVQISVVSYHYAQSGWAVFFYFLALLSINLAFVNVLPIPVLDGGHLLFLLIERIKGSPVSTKVLTYSQVLGLVFVIALMVFVTYNDIVKLL